MAISQTINHLLAILIFCGCLLSGCENKRITQVEKEIRVLRSELRELAQMQYEIENLRSHLQSPNSKKLPTKEQVSDSTPIFSQIFKSSDSHLDDPFLGPADSEVIVMGFGDFQCLPCRAFFKHVLPELKKDFIEEGKVKFIYRDFPLASKPHSFKAAKLAHCSGEQGAYWEMFDALYEYQSLLSRGSFDTIISKVSSNTKLNKNKLDKCTTSSRYNLELEIDLEEAKKLGAKGAPSFFIGKRAPREDENEKFAGVFVRGAQPYPVIKEQIKKVLGE